jgi:hypothetical protein
MRATVVVAMALGIAVCTPSFAETSAMDADVMCLAAIGLLPEVNQKSHVMSDEQAQQTTLMGTMYYMGKVTGRDPKFDLESALVARLALLDNTTLGTALMRCGGELQEQGGRWQAMGKHMMERAKDPSKP